MWKFFDKYGSQRLYGSSEVQVDFAQITASPAAITATTEATSVAVITGNSVNYDGGRVKIEVFFPGALGTTTTSKVYLVLYRDSTVIGRSVMLATTVETGQMTLEAFDTPPAGAHTYTVKAFVTAQVTLEAGAGGAGNLLPAYMRVTRVG